MPQRDFDYHLAEIRERLGDTRFLAGEALPDQRPFFYPCAYIDLLPFLRSGLSRGVYLDVAYFTPSRVPGTAFCLRASLIHQFFSDLFPGTVFAVGGDPVMQVGFVHEGRPKELQFVRAERSRLDVLAGLLPDGAGVVFDPELALADAESVGLGLRELAQLAPDLAYFRSDPMSVMPASAMTRRYVPAPRLGRGRKPAGVWLRRIGAEQQMAA